MPVPIVFVMLSLCLSGDESLGGVCPSSCDEQALLLRGRPSSAVGIKRDPSSAEGSRVPSLKEAISLAVGIVLLLVCRKEK